MASIHIPDDLLADLQTKATEQGKSLDEVAKDAFTQYLAKDEWQRLLAAKREAARMKGLTEADVPRLVEEARRERRGR